MRTVLPLKKSASPTAKACSPNPCSVTAKRTIRTIEISLFPSSLIMSISSLWCPAWQLPTYPSMGTRSTIRSTPRLERRHLVARDPAGDEAFSDVPSGKIKVTETAAELASCIETRDRPARRVDDLLFRIMDRPALRVGNRRPDLTENVRRTVDAHHRSMRAPVVL